ANSHWLLDDVRDEPAQQRLLSVEHDLARHVALERPRRVTPRARGDQINNAGIDLRELPRLLIQRGRRGPAAQRLRARVQQKFSVARGEAFIAAEKYNSRGRTGLRRRNGRHWRGMPSQGIIELEGARYVASGRVYDEVNGRVRIPVDHRDNASDRRRG